MNNDDFNIQPNNGDNLNNQPNIDSNPGNQILMGDTSTIDNLNQNMQPINPVNQEIQPVQPEPVQVEPIQPIQPEPVQSIQPEPVQSVQPEPVQSNPQLEQMQSLTQNNEVDTIFSNTSNVEQPAPKKGKGGKVIIIILLLAVLGVGGYFAYDKFFANKSTPTPAPTPTPVEKKILINDDSKEIVYSNIDELHNGVVRRIPAVNIKSTYADEINKEIKDAIKEGYLDGQVKDSALEYAVDYQYYINDEIVSLKFSWQTEGEGTFSKIYNIKKYTGEKVTNEEILKYVSIQEESLSNALVEAYKKAIPETTVADGPEKEVYTKDVEMLQNKTIKAMYINNKELMVLFDKNYVAGAGKAEAILNVTSGKLIKDPVTLQ